MKYPALHVEHTDSDAVLVAVDDHSPTAVEEHGGRALTIFFSDRDARDRARGALAEAVPLATITSRDVDDGDWARRSQENLQPITVGRVTVAPPWAVRAVPATSVDADGPGLWPLTVVIQPSMGFGTGHHATTRLCLGALQEIDLAGRTVLDVGTGSGILAIAAAMLGAREATGIDHDPDAIQSARENLGLNPGVHAVRFDVGDLRSTTMAPSDVVTANLTGTLLSQAASRLVEAARPGGAIVVSGLLESERSQVVAAFAGAELRAERAEGEWIALVFRVRT